MRNEKNETCRTTVRIRISAMRIAIRRVTIIRVNPRTVGPAGQHLDVLEVAQVGERPHVDLLEGLLAAGVGGAHAADRDPGG